jgi:hypothetical protein
MYKFIRLEQYMYCPKRNLLDSYVKLCNFIIKNDIQGIHILTLQRKENKLHLVTLSQGRSVKFLYAQDTNY